MKSKTIKDRVKWSRKWAAGKPLIVVIVAHQIAARTDLVLKWMQELRSGQAVKRLPHERPTREWLSLYRNHLRVMQRTTKLFPTGVDDETFSINEWDDFRLGARQLRQKGKEALLAELEAMPKDEYLRMLTESHKWAAAIAQFHFQELESELFGETPIDDVEMHKAAAMMEFQFLLCVIIPCWMEYQMSPTKLLSRARRIAHESNNPAVRKALDQLLRLDPTVIQEKRIAAYFTAEGIKKSIHHQDMLKAMGSKPSRRLNAYNLKVLIAAALVEISSMTTHPLNTSDLRRMFDALARDQKLGLRDEDLPKGGDAWAKAIQRARPLWRDFKSAGQK